jgi:hypothetical protein
MSDIVKKLDALKEKVSCVISYTEPELALPSLIRDFDDIIESVSDLENHVLEIGERDV